MEENSVFRMIDHMEEIKNGARFYRADLHNHTPNDPHFHCDGMPVETEEQKKEFASAYVQAVKSRGIEILGVTEHNDVSWIDHIREAANEAELIFFPGIELGAKDGKNQIHFIALFDPHIPQDDIHHFISSLKLPPGARFHPDGTPCSSQLDTTALTSHIVNPPDKNVRGLPIAAHVTGKNGLLQDMRGDARIKAYQDENLIAVEIPDSRNRLNECEKSIVSGEALDAYGPKSVACLNHSDGRGINQTKDARNRIGDKSTLIKLSNFSIEALRQAFLDFDSRIRLKDEIKDEKYPKIIGLAIEGGFLSAKPIEGQEKSLPFFLHFNPNLNTVIGGRGAGKSALLETIRYVFEIEARPDATKKQSDSIIDYILFPGAKAIVLYELTDGTRYIISRTKGLPSEVYSFDTKEKIDIHPAKLLPEEAPIEVYGQKEIFEISKDVNFQLKMLDSFISEPLKSVQVEEQDLLRSLRSNAQNILQIEEEIIQASESLSDLQRIRLELERMEKHEAVKHFKKKKQYDREETYLQNAKQSVESILYEIDKFKDERQSLKDVLPEDSILVTETVPDIEFIKSEAGRLNSIDDLITQSLDSLSAQVRNIWSDGENQRDDWKTRYGEVQEEYQSLLREMGSEDFSAERYFSLRAKLDALLGMEKQIEERQNRLVELKTERKQDLKNLRLLRREKEFPMRQEKAKELTESLSGTIQINLTCEGNREEFARVLTESFTGHRIQRDVIEKLSKPAISHADPVDLVQAIRKEKENPSDETSVLNTIYEISSAYRSRLAEIEDSVLYELETYRIPDLPDISLKVGTQYRSLNPPPGQAGLSTGQKCTAILSIILVERNAPLIIDQPEDDLDNEFIYREIVQTLRKEKERRQFIIATHNANIPVTGDAELIVLLHADESHGWIEQSGSIDDPKMREPVENVLEGGRDAFQMRQKKYGLPE